MEKVCRDKVLLRQKINLNKLDDLIQRAEGTEMQEGCKKFCGIIRTLAEYIAEYGGKYKKILRDTVAEEL
jgi:hypothetical protein